MPPTRQPQRNHICTVCDSRFSRLSHLQRHQLLHADVPQETFQCGLCDKSFNRKDVYLRHHRGVHGSNQSTRRTRRKKSCERCIRYKLKCSRELPCLTCKNRNVHCRYDTASPPVPQGQFEQSPADAIPLPDHETPHHGLNQWSEPDSGEHLHHPSDHNGHNGNTPNLRQDHPYSHLDESEYRHDAGIDSLLNAAQLNSKSGPQEPGPNAAAAESDHPRFSLEGQDHPWPSHEPDLVGPSIAPGLFHAPFDAGANETFDLIDFGLLFDGSTFQASKTDWLGAAADYSDRQTLGSVHLPSESPYDIEPRPLLDDVAVAATSTPVAQVLSNGDRADDLASKDKRSDWPHALDKGGNESWPFDYTSNKGYRKIKLPPLRQVLEQTVGHRPVIERATLLDLIGIFGSPYIPVLNDSPAPEALPAVTFLTKLVKVYFEEFHPVMNVIHVPTWKIENCPTALLASMACIGATYSPAEGSSEVAVLLAEITQRALFWAGQEDTAAWRDPAYITAMCLHHTYSLGSGNRRLYELADAARGVMVTSLRGIGVLAADSESEETTTDLSGLRQLDDAALEEAWAKWRSRELLKRVAWMVFEFDCTISTMTNKRGAFNISELPTRLPCSNSLWEAHSAKAWLSMVSFSASPVAGPPFYVLMQSLSGSRANLSAVPAWAKRLCALAISRILWDLKEMKNASAPNMFGMSSLAFAYKASSEALLQNLEVINESISSPKTTAEVVNLNVTCLSTYYTDLITRTSAMDLIIFIFRNSGREQSSRLAAELARAKEHLCSTFARNPIDTRRSVVSAANIVNVARECTSFTPCEVMRLFNGFAYLLAFARFFPFERLQRPGAAASEGAAKLDILPWRRTAQHETDLKAWIERGGRASLMPVEDICDASNFALLKQEGLHALNELRTWGLARKFYRVLQGLT